MKKAKPWYASKTVLFGIATALIGFLEALRTIPELPPQVLSAVGILIILLRLVTGEPIRR